MECFDVVNHRWSGLPRIPYAYTVGITALSIKARMVFCFGGRDGNKTPPDKAIERFLMLDTLKYGKGWKTIEVKNPTNVNGWNYGAFPLRIDIEEDTADILIFGGSKSNFEGLSRTCTIRTNLSGEDCSSMEILTSNPGMKERDSFLDNHFFPLPVKRPKSQLVGVVGYYALHVFDL